MFSNGTTPDSAVNYTASNALCGAAGAGAPVLFDPANAANLSLPLNAPGCTQRIGMTWVAKLTNWLGFALDGAGLNFAPGVSCDDPGLLLKALRAFANGCTASAVVSAPNTYLASFRPYVDASVTSFKSSIAFAATNTGPATINGQPVIIDETGAALSGGEIPTINRARFFFDGTSHRLLNPVKTRGAYVKVFDYTFDGSATSAIVPLAALAPASNIFRVTAFMPGNGQAYTYLGLRASYDGVTFLADSNYTSTFFATISDGSYASDTLSLPAAWYGTPQGCGEVEASLYIGSATNVVSVNGRMANAASPASSPNYGINDGNRDIGNYQANANQAGGPVKSIQILCASSYGGANGALIPAGARVIVEALL